MNFFKITLLLLLITHSGGAQDYQSKSELESEIKGTWHYENEPKSKLIFSNDTVRRYFGKELRSSGRYEITDCCEGEKLLFPNFFLKETNEDGSSFCSYIEGINFSNNGFFTLMTRMRGKIIVLKKDNY